jgi:DNA-binding LacI/PurR family transcriptional regulator
MRYRAHPFISALMSHVRGGKHLEYVSTLAHVVPSASAAASPFHQMYHGGARRRAEERGYGFELFALDDLGMSVAHFEKVLLARGVRGLVVASLPRDCSLYTQLNWAEFAAVTLGYGLDRPALHRASTDHFIGMQIALEQLRRRGYKRIGFYTDAVVDEWTNHRWSGAFLWEHHARKDSTAALIARKPSKACFLRWQRGYRPDAIVSNCIRVLDWIRSSKQRNESIAFVHLDYLPPLGDVAGIDQHGDAIAAAAVDIVIGQLQRQELGISQRPRAAMIAPTWREGGTVRSL